MKVESRQLFDFDQVPQQGGIVEADAEVQDGGRRAVDVQEGQLRVGPAHGGGAGAGAASMVLVVTVAPRCGCDVSLLGDVCRPLWRNRFYWRICAEKLAFVAGFLKDNQKRRVRYGGRG